MMNIIAPIALILVSILMFFGYINPTYTASTGATSPADKSITELQSDEKDYTDALAKTRQIEAVRESLLTKFNSLKADDKNKILKLLPNHIDSVRLIIDIDNIAAKYGMSLSNIALSTPTSGANAGANNSGNSSSAPATPDSAASAPASQSIGPDSNPYGSVTLGFSVTGPYGNFLQFLRDLEQSLRVVDVTSLSFDVGKPSSVTSGTLSKTALATGPDSYKYSVAIRTYYLK